MMRKSLIEFSLQVQSVRLYSVEKSQILNAVSEPLSEIFRT